MQWAIVNKFWRQHPTKKQLYGHLPPITKTIKIRRTRHGRHSWRNKDELISDILLWTPSHGRANAERPARTYIQQLCADTGCGPEELPVVRKRSGLSILLVRHDDDDDEIPFIYMYHQVMSIARYSLTFSRPPSLSTIAYGRSSERHPFSAQSWCKKNLLMCMCRSSLRTLLIGSSLLLPECATLSTNTNIK